MTTCGIEPVTHWQAAPAPSQEILEAVCQLSRVHPVVARIAARRMASAGEAARWLHPFGDALPPPLALHHLELAVERLQQALEKREELVIFGDYDTDGLTATALMEQALSEVGAEVTHFIPNRETEGYGLTAAAMKRCLREHPSVRVLVTVDCGITSVAEVAELMQGGIEVIVTDHHVPSEQLPAAVAVVNPRLGAPEGAEALCGCATAFTVIHALYTRLGRNTYKKYLDLVAVATVADVMPLTGENRALVKKGLHILSREGCGNPGLKALAKLQHVELSKVTAEDLAFRLVPCINAASRIGDWQRAYELLTCAAPAGKGVFSPAVQQRCEKAARSLDAANKERREIETRLRQKVEIAGVPPGSKVIIAAGRAQEGFLSGVLGIVAARLVEQHHLPAVVCCRKDDGRVCGSMRSKGAWHAVKALETVADLCEHFGGHAAAAGFTLRPGTFEAFCNRLPLAFAACDATPDVLAYEEDLASPIDLELWAGLQVLEPCGTGNPKPRFAKIFTLLAHRVIGKDKTHLSLKLRETHTAAAPELEAIWFGGAHRAESWQEGMRLRVLFSLSEDRLQSGRLKLNIVDAFPIS